VRLEAGLLGFVRLMVDLGYAAQVKARRGPPLQLVNALDLPLYRRGLLRGLSHVFYLLIRVRVRLWGLLLGAFRESSLRHIRRPVEFLAE